ncbi:MAG: zinc dependent phospholipase C family protein [Acidobacteriota bacterium]|nr:zinc dependent phospholipase C family protein [Acidobacteriota bacterium]
MIAVTVIIKKMNVTRWRGTARVLLAALALLVWVPDLGAYSVLTHEAIIDTCWEHEIAPLLLKRFPASTPDQLIEAHAQAYGGAIIQDMGYYPFGSRLFSDLVHYARSGDFVIALLQDAQDLNEYAFALGALAHYAADNSGHPIAVNHVVPMLYPKLRAKFGNEITYADDPNSHLKTEFGFDVIEVAHGNYAPKSYHDFVGFKVSKPLLERAFEETYSIPLKSIFKSLDLALGTYRRTISSIIPEMSKTAWAARKNEIQQTTPGISRQKFIYNLSRASYEKEWGKDYERPGLGARFLAFIFRIVPKIGLFKALGFKVPTPPAEKLFVDSFNKTVDTYRALLAAQRTDRLKLPNENFDTGKPTREGEYRLADNAYATLLEKLADQKAVPAPELRANILAFYTVKLNQLSEKARQELESLKSAS